MTILYKDVNPNWDAKQNTTANPEFVYGVEAIFAALGNLLSCPRGGRSRIGTPSYFSGVFHLLQEPHDNHTANQLEMAINQAVQKWEPRVTWSRAIISVLPLGYSVELTATVDNTTQTENILLRTKRY